MLTLGSKCNRICTSFYGTTFLQRPFSHIEWKHHPTCSSSNIHILICVTVTVALTLTSVLSPALIRLWSKCVSTYRYRITTVLFFLEVRLLTDLRRSVYLVELSKVFHRWCKSYRTAEAKHVQQFWHFQITVMQFVLLGDSRKKLATDNVKVCDIKR